MSRTWRLLLWPLLVVTAVGASFAYLDMDTAGLFSGKGLGQMAAYASEFFPPDLSAPHLRAIGRGLLETLAMSAIGTLLAALLGLLFALPAAGRFGVPAQSLARLLLNALRAVPKAGLGCADGAGGRARAERRDPRPGAAHRRRARPAVRRSPGEHPGAARRGLAPGRQWTPRGIRLWHPAGVWPQLVAYTLYRWENNIRMASVLGFVGAGGLGQMLYFSLSLFQQAQAATVILAMLVLVLGVDSLSAWARQRWVSQ